MAHVEEFVKQCLHGMDSKAGKMVPRPFGETTHGERAGEGVKHDVETGAPFTGDQNLSMDIVVRPGALANASSSAYRHKGILLDVTLADP